MPRFELLSTKFRIHPPRGLQDAAPEFILMEKLMRTLGAELLSYNPSTSMYDVTVPSLQIDGFKRWMKKEGWWGRLVLPDGTTKFI